MYYFWFTPDIFEVFGVLLGGLILVFLYLLVFTFYLVIGVLALVIVCSIGWVLFTHLNRIFFSITGKGFPPEKLKKMEEDFHNKTLKNGEKIKQSNNI